jgi:heat shock protein HslJ
MKKLLFILSIVMLQLACGTSRKTTTELNGNWELVIFPASTKTLSEIFTMKRPEIQLENGRLTGSTGCNRMNGTYTASGTSLEIGNNLAITKMGCPNYDESIFIEALNKVNRFQVKDNQLILMQDSVMVMTFAKQK